MTSGVKFRRPPIIELVLGVQFAPLVGMNSGHLGWFWKQYLSKEWVKAVDAVAIADQFETFNEKRGIGWGFQMGQGMPPQRLQISTESGDRMIQVQPSRFHYNWQRKDQAYPSYPEVKKEFDAHFKKFVRFVKEAGLGEVVCNQWEITYVDHVPQGELWETPMDWHRVLPGFFSQGQKMEGIAIESVVGEWHFEITPQRGRLHCAVQLGRVGAEAQPALVLTTTARGPLGIGTDLNAGLTLGHEKIRQAFLEITSAEAQESWERVDQ